MATRRTSLRQYDQSTVQVVSELNPADLSRLRRLGSRLHSVSVGPLTRMPPRLGAALHGARLHRLTLSISDDASAVAGIILRHRMTLRSVNVREYANGIARILRALARCRSLDAVEAHVWTHQLGSALPTLRQLNARSLTLVLRGRCSLPMLRAVNRQLSSGIAFGALVIADGASQQTLTSVSSDRVKFLAGEQGQVHTEYVAAPRCVFSNFAGPKKAKRIELLSTLECASVGPRFLKRLQAHSASRLDVLSENIDSSSLLALLKLLTKLKEVWVRPVHLSALEAWKPRCSVRLCLMPPRGASPRGRLVASATAVALGRVLVKIAAHGHVVEFETPVPLVPEGSAP